ncbi:tyrosine--tRNA ligase [Novosphingobium pentaromativorans]|uniref:Tyrosine--tRNA ligase n=1 Tax=Novosphingobium pentaromativorans US6-1 TaxID=1088721 RepID=G6EJ57_9SPHN|nr:tyrosine--tRNA ligase [Novosphingobium pentaromativorans]AIT79016.1 tyrosyl-tRNA synthetase [Novosphingobium pentaromativorans US6-1]EHJ58643.1 tyrosyl-tRNA synthetase [Novosphingobium pentaromativorans US6-1]
MTYNSSLLRLLDERGYIHQMTDAEGLDALASKQVVPGYVGFDATASSLHVGNLVSIMLLRRLQQAGHKPVVLMGGGTTRIGDPTGKDEVRKMLSDEAIEANIASIRTAFERFLTFGDGPTDAVMVNNHDWLGQIGYIEMLQKVGTHFTVNRMLSFDSVKLRLEREQPMTFLEFNYMILQGYDFRHLSDTMGVRLQMGGSDQWGNIVNGVELARRMDGKEVFGLTTPLITKADGSKMGKSVSGAVWLNEDALSSYDYWQFWRNCDDRDVGKFLRLFTDLPLDEIARLEALEGGAINDAKVILANEATRLCRGEEAARAAEATAAQTFAGGGLGEDLPTVEVSAEGIRLGAACTALGFTASNGEAKRKIGEGAVKLDDALMDDPGMLITVPAGETRKLSLGKKKHGILKGA